MEILKGIAESLNIEPAVVIAQSISFVILVGVLIKFLYRPVESVMRQRQEQIANSLAGADANEKKAESLRKEYEAHLANVADEARAKLDQAVKDAEAARQRMIAAAQTDIQALNERNQAQLALDREQLRRDLRKEMADIAVLAASKALRSQLTPDIQSSVIDQVIKDLDTPSSQSPMA
ncbi:MAG TPA: F0F1 ATP synthase subunit B [Armatimonadota bacterium]|nr:F0F1 ATP synthase subunit B [Armatimonadota bacterium]